MLNDINNDLYINIYQHNKNIEEINKKIKINYILNNIKTLSKTKFGSFYIQDTMDILTINEIIPIIEIYKNNIKSLIKCRHGNYILQQILIKVPLNTIIYIYDEININLFNISTHKYGCRIIIKLIKYHLQNNFSLINNLIEKLFFYQKNIFINKYSKFIILSILEEFNFIYKKKILDLILLNINELITNKNGSFIITNIIKYCTDIEKQLIFSSYKSQNLHDEKINNVESINIIIYNNIIT